MTFPKMRFEWLREGVGGAKKARAQRLRLQNVTSLVLVWSVRKSSGILVHSLWTKVVSDLKVAVVGS